MEQAYWLAWTKVSRVGPATQKQLFLHFGDLAVAWRASVADLAAVSGIGRITAEAIAQDRPAIDPLQLWEEHSRANSQWITPIDESYPPLLWEISDPPPVLYYRGALTGWQSQLAVALVGTRSPTAYGRRWALRLAETLAQREIIVVSGLADGIDGEAHRGCLNAGGATIAIVATGLDQTYPSKHRALDRQIEQSGLIVSEYAWGTPPDRSHFPRRNRIIAGLCRATVVVEAPQSSGALITAHLANDYGRDVYAVPNSLEVPEAQGCLKLLSQGAQLVLGCEEFCANLGLLASAVMPTSQMSQQGSLFEWAENSVAPTIPESLQAIAQAIPSHESISLDQLVEHLGLPLSSLSPALLELELLGAIAQQPGLRYRRL
ncbi:MAG: DNA-protecting protein DprA [Oscillatoriales cyanobacterium SM2_2_1]|nr:DNA-protecting protein DprA [Oscillatoriales cyanobacterium SM2_2_1]